MANEKVIRDGNVAVLYSPGFGAGWFSWNTNFPDCVFNPELVAAVEAGTPGKCAEIAERLYGNEFYTGGAEDLKIRWLPVGTPFTIHDYDGSESIQTSTDFDLVS